MTIEIQPVAIEKHTIQSINLPLQSVDFSGEFNHKVTPLIQKPPRQSESLAFSRPKPLSWRQDQAPSQIIPQNIETPVRLFDVFGWNML